MPHPTALSKVVQIIQSKFESRFSKWLTQLKLGKLYKVEKQVRKLAMNLFDELMGGLLKQASAKFCKRHVAPRGAKSQVRSHGIRLSSGTKIEVQSPYYRKRPEGYTGSLRPLLEHWSMQGSSTPLLVDFVGYASMTTASYELANQLVNKFGTQVCTSSTRKISQSLAMRCEQLGAENLIVQSGEDVGGKRVVISVDGGRTRTREYKDEYSDKQARKFDTPWREPKLFVIDILNEDGSTDRQELPLYGAAFSDEKMLDLLRRYLEKLGIERAAHVQFIADGAVWIWNRVIPLLHELGVKPERLTQTLDYYHALEYLHKLIKALPKRVGKNRRNELTEQCKRAIWQGKSDEVVKELSPYFKRAKEEVRCWLNYLEKHKNRMQYADYQRNKLMCGSGLMESAVRRIINLRFKSAATFWLEANVEPLYFLRGALLSKRWDVVMKNLQKLS